MTPEQRFRHASDLPPMTPAEYVAQSRDESLAIKINPTIAIAAALALLAMSAIALASPQIKNDRVMAIPEVGTTVRPESKRCKYKSQRSTLAPAYVCRKGRV